MNKNKFCPFRGPFSPCSDECGMFDASRDCCGILSVADHLQAVDDKLRWVDHSIDRIESAIRGKSE